MPLTLVATPIGHPKDITLRALEVLQEAEVIIGEERREASTLLKKLGLSEKRLELLNEHSGDKDVKDLLELCNTLKVALISDCGTPAFFDPGANLVRMCRDKKIPVTSAPGASSLMVLLSLLGHKVAKFYFAGFLPRDREERDRALAALPERETVILMDTPYRLKAVLEELANRWPMRRAVLGCDLTAPEEVVAEDTLKALAAKFAGTKAEFILAVL